MNGNTHLQHELINNVRDEIQLSPSYILLIIFSAIIATLGLLTNSTAVVIGAMLIAPLFWPIMGITLSIFTTRKQLARIALVNGVLSVVVVISIAAVITWLAPFTELTPEIRARLEPNLMDLFIALASSVIGVVAIYYPRISSTATGVAISIALLPPLCVTGIGVAFWSWDMVSRSFLLFGTNIAAMIFAGLITLYILHFRPNKHEEQSRFRVGFIFSLVLLIVLSVPLTQYLRNTLEQNRISKVANTVLVDEFSTLDENARLDEIEVNYVEGLDSEVTVEATVYVPEGAELTISERNTIIERLAEETGYSVELQLNVLNTLVLRRQEDIELRNRRNDIETFIRSQVQSINQNVQIEEVDITIDDRIDTVVILLRQNDSFLEFEDTETITNSLSNFTGRDAFVAVEFIPVERITKPSEFAKVEATVEAIVRKSVIDIDTGAYVQSLTITESANNALVVQLDIAVPEGVEVAKKHIVAIEEKIRKNTEYQASVNSHVFAYSLPGTVVIEEDQSL